MRPRSPVEQLAVELLQARLPTWRAGHRKQIPLSAAPEVLDTVTRLRRLGVRIGISLQALESSRSALSLWRRWKARTERQQARQAWRAAHPAPRLNALLPAERAAVRALRARYPRTDYRRLTSRLAREAQVYLSADTVYGILRDERLLRGSVQNPTLGWPRLSEAKPSRPDQLWTASYMVVRHAEGSSVNDAPDHWLLLILDAFSRRVVTAEVLPFDVPSAESRGRMQAALAARPPGCRVTRDPSDLQAVATDLAAHLAEHGYRLQRTWSLGYAEARRFGRLPRYELVRDMSAASRRRLPEMRQAIPELLASYNEGYPLWQGQFLTPAELQRGPEVAAQLVAERARMVQEARRHRQEVNRAARRQAGPPPEPTPPDATPAMSTACHSEGAA